MNLYNNEKELQNIIKKYIAGKATPEEILFVESYYDYLGKNGNILDSLESLELNALEEENFKAIQFKISRSEKEHKQIPFYRYAAAILAMLFICGSLYLSLNKNIKPNFLSKQKTIDVLPGGDKAILTLGNGSKVILDDQTDSNISEENGLKISKTKNGQLIYTIINKPQTVSVAYNTIETPKGGQYQIILPDGTKVWLNAASSLTYPEVFVGDIRKVKLKGEAYFEVTSVKQKGTNKKMAFIVTTSPAFGYEHGQDVEVLGTHFNINGYMDDRTIKTTLLEGSVKVSSSSSVKILKPGDQSILGIDNNFSLLHNVDTDDETAWKNGQFRFSNAALGNILSQLERWYDIKIDYTNVPKKRYNGMVPRKANLSQVLTMLELTGNIKFKIEEGRQLKVIDVK